MSKRTKSGHPKHQGQCPFSIISKMAAALQLYNLGNSFWTQNLIPDLHTYTYMYYLFVYHLYSTRDSRVVTLETINMVCLKAT